MAEDKRLSQRSPLGSGFGCTRGWVSEAGAVLQSCSSSPLGSAWPELLQVFEFTHEDLPSLLTPEPADDPIYPAARPFLLEALRPEANAFVLNVNAISVAVAGESSGTERMAVDHHIDDTLRVGQTAEWVTVLVLRMPPTSIDGELTLHVPAKEGTELFSSSSPTPSMSASTIDSFR